MNAVVIRSGLDLTAFDLNVAAAVDRVIPRVDLDSSAGNLDVDHVHVDVFIVCNRARNTCLDPFERISAAVLLCTAVGTAAASPAA